MRDIESFKGGFPAAGMSRGGRVARSEGDPSAYWPVGSVFISVVATNPAEVFGFGTWEPLNGGRALIAIDANARGWKRTV